jgi:tetratricopeptide (TPR) repeat protein
MNTSVQQWLDELTAAPPTAIHKLVFGYSGVTAWSRSSLRESFVEIFQTHAEALDAAVADWLHERLMKLPPEKTPKLVWASHLQDLFGAVAGLPLPQIARLLRDRLRDFRSWLHPLQTDESLDPEAAYLAALAWADTNRNLEDMWHGLVLRLDREPDYYTDIGLLGLRKARDDRGQLPSKATFLLLATLIDLADTNNISQKEWLLTTRALLGGYHYNTKTWVREFKPVLQARQNARNGPEWLKKVLPELQAEQPFQQRSHNVNKPTRSKYEVDEIVREVEEHGPQALGERLAAFVERQRAYANATSETHYLVRTFNRLAKAARLHDTDWATARIREALAWDEDNAYHWTVYASCLWTRGFNEYQSDRIDDAEYYCLKAIGTLWTAQYRFWGNEVVSNELGKLYREAGDLQSAELIYREAIERFPRSAASFVGLARVLVDAGDPAGIEEAIIILQRNLVLFPDDYHSYFPLARIYEHRFKSTGDKNYEKEMNELRIKGYALRDAPSRKRFAQHKQEPVPVLKRPSVSAAVPDSPEAEESANDSAGSADLASEHFKEPADKEQESLHTISLEVTRDRDSESQYVSGDMASGDDQTPIGPLGSQELGKESLNEFFPGAEKDIGTSELEAQNVNHEEDREQVPLAMPNNIDLGPEQRLGLALLFQWRARRFEPGEEREHWFTKAHDLLNFPDESAGFCRPAFAEARGFLMLARDQVSDAVGYFEAQIGISSPPPLGLCLGLAQARARLGETMSEAEECDLDSRVQYHCRGSILPLVLKVIRLLEPTLSGELLRTALIELYPKTKEVLHEFRSIPNSKRTRAQDQDLMISQLIDHYLFRPATVQSVSDLQSDGVFSSIRKIGRDGQDRLQFVYEKVALVI